MTASLKRWVGPALRLLLAAAAILLALMLTVGFFMRIPTEGNTLAVDWKLIRPGIADWSVTYGPENGLRYPPWCALLLLPLGWIPLAAGWGVVAFLTLMILPLTLPRKGDSLRRLIPAVLALVMAFPVLRTIADGNIEFLILGGLILLEAGILRKNPALLAAGVLLSAAKVQETWILLLFLPLLAGRKWGARRGGAVLLLLALVVVPTLAWKGREWIFSMASSPFRGSAMDSSLMAAIQRLDGSPAVLFLLWAAVLGATVAVGGRYIRGYSRDAVGFLSVSSLLLAPYASSNNLLIPYAMAMVPLMRTRRWEGAVLVALTNLPYLLVNLPDIARQYGTYYWTLVMVFAWMVFAVRIRRKAAEPGSPAGTASQKTPVHDGSDVA
ncbi:MAG: glycosyltransferase 87 family protein [Anaerolineales bacterium]